ncbi:hypothetical protein RN001_015909 [Aquatica leii]|uniref:Uncharacterized protein n=1 Tax=Aquatica leii TaxID=1421715 RepID=A0AAN7SMW9_9COLE|nr:hypothetical protein RN001_015909 [Aquatica leii]
MEKTTVFHLLRFFIFQQLCAAISATCYFPPEFQGEYKMQSTNSGDGVQYSVLNITGNSIPIWGNCHRRIGNNFILMINSGSNSCIRCLHLKLRSKNILQVNAASQESISKKCYTREESAEANCPTELSVQKRTTTEIILFKTKDLEGSNIQREFCPLYNNYNLRYFTTDKFYRRECIGFESDLDTCPSGSTLNIHFRQCLFDNYDLKFDCLGEWEGPNGQMHIALLDNRHFKKQLPQYRCGLYKRNESTGSIYLSLGKDSTCNTDLHNATYGHEVFELVPKEETSWPREIAFGQCNFPEWLIGNWEHARVDEKTFIYLDHNSFKTYTIKCVEKNNSDDKYLVFTRTQCGEEQYNCLKIKKRSTNIIEFQLGTNFSKNKDVFDLCSETNFQDNNWITQGRLNRKLEASCPISGEYTGVIPDNTEFCAKLWSDCRAPELMYYQVSDCVTSEVVEEREYRCLGHWTEGELLYTYTQRKDVASEAFECFVGSIISEKEDIYIKEAGEHCQRLIDPLQYGMKLIKQGLYSCIGSIPNTHYDVTTKRLSTIQPNSASTKSWNIGAQYPAIPDNYDNTIGGAASILSVKYLVSFIIFVNVIVYF